jgi:hypothetical protein
MLTFSGFLPVEARPTELLLKAPTALRYLIDTRLATPRKSEAPVQASGNSELPRIR